MADCLTSRGEFVNQRPMTPSQTGVSRLVGLASWLAEHQPLWEPRPFTGLPVTWEAVEPEVAAALRALPLETVEAYESRPGALPDMPPAYREWSEQARRWSELPRLSGSVTDAIGEPRPPGIPGRKWEQIRSFCSVALQHRPAGVAGWLDWCAGKGHLGRTLALAASLPMTCVERDAELCRRGRNLAVARGVTAEFVVADVLASDNPELSADFGVVALHACGGLHRRLLHWADVQGGTYLVLAPCCYHRFLVERVEPLSTAGRERCALRLTRDHLRLIGLCETVASRRRQQLRRREQAFRLGLDLLLRQVTGVDSYRALGPAPRSWVDLPFADFCRKLAARAELDLPATGWAAERFEQLGWERLRLTRALGLVRGLFRRPLETWLLEDQVEFLRERGWTVRLGSFCSEQVTPRNGMIVAWR